MSAALRQAEDDLKAKTEARECDGTLKTLFEQWYTMVYRYAYEMHALSTLSAVLGRS